MVTVEPTCEYVAPATIVTFPPFPVPAGDVEMFIVGPTMLVTSPEETTRITAGDDSEPIPIGPWLTSVIPLLAVILLEMDIKVVELISTELAVIGCASLISPLTDVALTDGAVRLLVP